MMLASSIALIAALATRLDVAPAYALPRGAVTNAALSAAAVPGALPYAQSRRRFDAEVCSAMYGLREAFVQRWLWPKSNATYGAPANFTGKSLADVDLLSKDGGADVSSACWVSLNAAPEILADELKDHSKRVFSSPRLSAKIATPVDSICEAVAKNKSLCLAYRADEGGYNGAVTTWLDPSVDHLALVGSKEDWMTDGDAGAADYAAGFLRPLANCQNDVAPSEGQNLLYGNRIGAASLRGGYAAGVMLYKIGANRMDSSAFSGNAGYTASEVDARSGTPLSQLLSTAAPGLPQSAEKLHTIATNVSRRIDWNRFALANAAISVPSWLFMSDIARGEYLADDVSSILPGGCQNVAKTDYLEVQSKATVAFELEDETPASGDFKIFIGGMADTNGNEQAVFYVATTNAHKQVEKESTNAVEKSTSCAYVNNYEYFYLRPQSEQQEIPLRALLTADYYANALSTDNGGEFSAHALTFDAGRYDGTNFYVSAQTVRVGEQLKAIFAICASYDFAQTLGRPELADAAIFTFDPMVSKRKSRIEISPTFSFVANIPSEEETPVVDLSAFDGNSNRGRAPGLFSAQSPLASAVDSAAVLNYTSIFATTQTVEEVIAGKTRHYADADESKDSCIFSRLVKRDLSAYGAAEFQEACEAPFKTLRDDVKEQEAAFFSKLKLGTPSFVSMFEAETLDLSDRVDNYCIVTSTVESVTCPLESSSQGYSARIGIPSGIALLVQGDDEKSLSWVAADADTPTTNMWLRIQGVQDLGSATNSISLRSPVMSLENFSSLLMRFNFPAMQSETKKETEQ